MNNETIQERVKTTYNKILAVLIGLIIFVIWSHMAGYGTTRVPFLMVLPLIIGAYIMGLYHMRRVKFGALASIEADKKIGKPE